jgi:hypothetical protein
MQIVQDSKRIQYFVFPTACVITILIAVLCGRYGPQALAPTNLVFGYAVNALVGLPFAFLAIRRSRMIDAGLLLYALLIGMAMQLPGAIINASPDPWVFAFLTGAIWYFLAGIISIFCFRFVKWQ